MAACTWLEDHPKVLEIKSYSSSPPLQVAATQVYFDLTEVKQWQNVSISPIQSSQLLCFRAQEPESEDLLHIIPLSPDVSVTMEM